MIPKTWTPHELRRALRLYLILGPEDTDDPLSLVQQAIAGGVTFVQWRDKNSIGSKGDVQAMCRVCHNAQVPFLINDDVALAKAVGADGVHLGQNDMPTAQARAVLGDRTVIGLSVGSDGEAAKYEPKVVDYVGVGPLFATTTKVDAGKPLGWSNACALLVGHRLKPAVFIGGISPQSLSTVKNQKVPEELAGFAVVSTVTKAKDPQTACNQLLDSMPLLLEI